MAQDDCAILIGITRYPNLQPLGGPENDVASLRHWLIDPAKGSVPEDNVTCILSNQYPDNGDQPWLVHADQAFERLIRLGNENMGRAGRRLYMFLAGHGISPGHQGIENTALLMANASDIGLHHLPGQIYANWFRAAAYFEEIVLVMDCCRDDRPAVEPHYPPWGRVHNAAGADVRMFTALSTRWGRVARESEVDGVTMGIFTRAFIDALNYALPDENGRVLGGAIAGHVYHKLQEHFAGQAFQEPQFHYEPQRDICFRDGVQLQSVEVMLILPDGVAAVDVEVVNARSFEPSGALAATNGAFQIGLIPGSHLIRLVGIPDRHQAIYVTREGETFDVAL